MWETKESVLSDKGTTIRLIVLHVAPSFWDLFVVDGSKNPGKDLNRESASHEKDVNGVN